MPQLERPGSGAQPAIQSDANAHVASLCDLIAVFLGHGLVGHR